MKAHGIVDPHFGLWGDSHFHTFLETFSWPAVGLFFGSKKNKWHLSGMLSMTFFWDFFDREFVLERGDLWEAPLGDMIVC